MALSLNGNDNWLVDVNKAGTYTLATAGKYLDRNIAVSVPNSGSPSNQAKSGKNYAEVDGSTLELVDENGVPGYLYITEGYTNSYKINLDTLLPDFDSQTYINSTSNQILSGYAAYDEKGNRIAGTMAKINPNSAYYTLSTSGAGFENSDIGAGNLANTFQIIAGHATISGGGLTVVDNYKKDDLLLTQSASAGGGTAEELAGIKTTSTSEKPPESGYYVAVQSSTPAVDGDISVVREAVTVTVTKDGWITADSIEGVVGQGTITPSVSVNATNKTLYIPLDTATCTVTGGDLTLTGFTIKGEDHPVSMTLSTDTKTVADNVISLVDDKDDAGDYYVVIKAIASEVSDQVSASFTDIKSFHTAGYIPGDQNAIKAKDGDGQTKKCVVQEGSKTQYLSIKKSSGTISGGRMTAFATGECNITGSTGVSFAETVPTSGTYYTITASATASTVSRAKVIDLHTAGYLPASSDPNGDSIKLDGDNTIDVTVSPKNLYLLQQTYGTIVAGSGDSETKKSDGTYIPSTYVFKTSNSGYNINNQIVATIATYLGETI